MTPQESRALLASLRQRASAAGLAGPLANVDSVLGVAAQRAIAILEAALSGVEPSPAPAAAPAIAPPRMPSMARRPPAPAPARQPAAGPRPSVLAGLKKPEAKLAEASGWPEIRMPDEARKTPKMTGWDPSDDDIPL